MRAARLPGLVFGLTAAVAASTAALGSESDTYRVRAAVVAPADDSHLAWQAASEFKRLAKARGLQIELESASVTGSDKPLNELLIMPSRSLATQVPALQIMELPFFYSSLSDVHERLDGQLGEYLVDMARKGGWEIVAYWDEGMHVFSGLKRYDRAHNLKAREFLIIRPDPVAEKQFQYWKADARRIRAENRAAVLRECLIASRAATLQEILREELHRVHLAISLTKHRYEGWVVVAPAKRWVQLDAAIREKLRTALQETTVWQRNDAEEREAAALAELERQGMTVYEVDGGEREAFQKALPDWAELLSDGLDMNQKRQLIELASAGTATVPGPGIPSAPEARTDPTPGAIDRQRH